MKSDLIPKINTAIKFAFYFLFATVPLAMFPTTFELFEFNKMWLTFAVALFIAFLWGAKMILEGRILIRRTPLDIPIALFLLSQIISTIFSLDPHVSFWGYYSRFNGGLLSIATYIFLYYAFATNLIGGAGISANPGRKISYKLLIVGLVSGLAVTLWGLPSHFGYDPTCFVFRGTLDVSCWTEAFQPRVRIFSTLGQPNWLGTFLAILIPIAIAAAVVNLKQKTKALKLPIFFLVLSMLFYVALLWSRSQSSFLGLALGMVLFLALLLFLEKKEGAFSIKALVKQKYLRLVFILITLFALTTFFIGTPLPSLNKYFTFNGIATIIQTKPKSETPKIQPKTDTAAKPQESFSANPNIEIGGTESSKIRLIVWTGALELFKRHPIFGTGVETYAYAYYKVKPLAHNLTSEWDYLYNKAHNEYLNYLATTGAFGLAAHLLIIVFFFYYGLKHVLKQKNQAYLPLSLAILGSFVAIIVSNFFGFSVVVVNLYFFLLPIFFFDLSDFEILKSEMRILGNRENSQGEKISPVKMGAIVVIGLVALYYEFYLLNFWNADRKYALGYNLNKAAEFVQAYPHLTEAVKMMPGEDLYRDELSINLATLAILLNQQNQASQAAEFAMQAKNLSDETVRKHPNNIVFYKTRTRVAFALSQIDPSYIDLAIEAIKHARELAPTDAKIAYNMGLFYNQKGDNENTIKYLKEATRLKPNYIDAYYALALFYSQLAKQDANMSLEYTNEARKTLEYILKNVDPNHTASKELLKSL